jgi:hypothetical protein
MSVSITYVTSNGTEVTITEDSMYGAIRELDQAGLKLLPSQATPKTKTEG